MPILFRTTHKLIHEIDEFLDTVSQGLIVFVEGVRAVLRSDLRAFEERIEAIEAFEGSADCLRRSIECDLYGHSLIPEHRGDVLLLLEGIDDLIDMAKETLNQFLVEQPFIPEAFQSNFMQLAETSVQAGEAVIVASRAFFKNPAAVRDDLHKVYFFEKEADSISNQLKMKVFRSNDLDLPQKMHLRYFALHIDTIADQAEAIADRLSIFTIKRTV